MVATSERTRVSSQRVSRLNPDIESPDLGTFTLAYDGVAQCGEYAGFQGKGMRTRCRVMSRIHAPNDDDPNNEWHDLEVSRWMSPVLHDERSHGYKLAKALDPNFELDYDEFTDPETGRIGKDYDFVEVLAAYEGSLYVSLVGPNQNGYPDVQGDPAPYIAPENRRRRGARPAITATVVEPEGASDTPVVTQPATQRQLRYLAAVAREAGVDADEIAEELYGVTSAALTREQASKLLDVIQTPVDGESAVEDNF